MLYWSTCLSTVHSDDLTRGNNILGNHLISKNIECIFLIISQQDLLSMCVWDGKQIQRRYLDFIFNGEFLLECDLSFTVFTFLLAMYQSACICLPTPETIELWRQKIPEKNDKGERRDWMKSGIQTRVVTNREFYELQTCWNGVQCVCSSSYRLAGSRGGWELPHLCFVKMVWFIFRMRGSHWGGIRPVSPHRFMDH